MALVGVIRSTKDCATSAAFQRVCLRVGTVFAMQDLIVQSVQDAYLVTLILLYSQALLFNNAVSNASACLNETWN